MIELKNEQPFAKGGNRLCFIHPNDPSLCIKVRRPDFTLKDLRRKKGFPRNLRPLFMFDDNREEYQVIQQLKRTVGDQVFEHVYRCYGFVETDLGAGLVTELLCDTDGLISVSLKQYIWEQGWNNETQQAVQQLVDFWLKHLIPSRELLPHNIVVQCDAPDNIRRLVVIDGLGDPTIVPYRCWPQSIKKNKVIARVKRFYGRVNKYLARCEAGEQPSKVGVLLQRGNNHGTD